MKEQILIVDDEKEIADLLEVYLKNDGFEVHKFYSGREAMDCIHNKIGFGNFGCNASRYRRIYHLSENKGEIFLSGYYADSKGGGRR